MLPDLLGLSIAGSLALSVTYVTCGLDRKLRSPRTFEHAYCQSEYFRVRCGVGEVLVIAHARYGRMRISRCVREHFGYVDCSADVADVLDRHCSGRRSCSVRVLDDNFNNVRPCHDDLKSYLEVRHQCVKGMYDLIAFACKLSLDTDRHADRQQPMKTHPGSLVTLIFLDPQFEQCNICSVQAHCKIIMTRYHENAHVNTTLRCPRVNKN